jgi:myo-inositol-1(or 4)-monophosphatase
MEYGKIIDLVKSSGKMMIGDGSTLKVTEKGKADFVTQIDFNVQRYITGELKRLHPGIQIMAEEKENTDIDFTKPFWILDPVDGTTNLVHKFHHSAVSLALHDGDNIIFGIVYNPFSDEAYHAVREKGCFLNNERIQVSSAKCLSDSLIMTGTSSYYKDMADGVFNDILKVFKRCQDIRRTGSAALDLAYTACGRVDGFFERALRPWDIAAGILLVEEAGGITSNYSGEKITLDSKSNIIAGGFDVHRELIKLINE